MYIYLPDSGWWREGMYSVEKVKELLALYGHWSQAKRLLEDALRYQPTSETD